MHNSINYRNATSLSLWERRALNNPSGDPGTGAEGRATYPARPLAQRPILSQARRCGVFRPILLLFLLSSSISARADQPDDSTLVVDELVVILIDQNRVPAGETGMITDISVHEGDAVTAGQPLGKLDDRRAQVEATIAKTHVQMATEKFNSSRAGDLANKELAEARQSAEEHRLIVEIANRKADNETRVLASKKSQAVAKNELDRANQARQRFVDSVSRSEIDGLRLAYEKSRLEASQAEFDRQIDRLQAQAEQEAATGHQLKIERSSIEVEQSVADRKIQQLELNLYQQQHELARLTTLRHMLLAPYAGVVAEVLHREGDWVRAGDPVIRVIRLDRLCVEGFVSAEKSKLLTGELMLQIFTNEATITRKGQIVFISSEIDPVNNEVKFRVEFANPDRDVLPGMRLRLRAGS